MEELEIHSRSYLLRWVNVTSGHSISWSIQPRKKTIGFGLFKHPGNANDTNTTLPDSSTLQDVSPTGDEIEDSKRQRHASNASVADAAIPSVVDKLQKLGIKSVSWTGKCDADRVSTGHYDVPEGESGMYGLLFDNTQSKQFSKTVTFVLMTYPTNAPPKSGHHIPFTQASSSGRSPSLSASAASKKSPKLAPLADSNENIPGLHDARRTMLAAGPRPKSVHGTTSVTSFGGSFYTGVLSKKRRKRNQGYARRFFSLDFTSSTISYYKNRNSSALRGAIPLSLAAVGANAKSRIISIDSGAEIWLLKAHNQQDFDGWREALEQASQEKVSAQTPPRIGEVIDAAQQTPKNPAEEREWRTVEALVGRVAGITDAVRRMAKDSDPKYLSTGGTTSTTSSPAETTASDDYFTSTEKPEKPSFWRRKSSSHNQAVSISANRNFSAQRLVPPSPVPSGSQPYAPKIRGQSRQPDVKDADIHGHCMAVLRDLDSVVANFSSLIAESRQRRAPARSQVAPRLSVDSTRSEEFFDASDGDAERRDGAISPLLQISRDNEIDEGDPERFNDTASINSSSTVSNADVTDMTDKNLFPTRPKSMHPLPHDRVRRRETIPAAKGTPPSLVSFLRKNIGKDLSTIAMPVTANEPLSLLQRSAEPMEYSSLLDAAAIEKNDPARRLLFVTAFAIASLASSRARERAIRKPFNPLLGETYELVREDLGFRFIAEKVSHRPVRIATQADGGLNKTATGGAAWTYVHSPAPSQKFWGKSAELITQGRVRVRLHDTKECYAWTPANCFLRNIIAGEKYMEPVGSMTVTEETSGRRATVTFKAGGMFSGRSEDVTVAAFDEHGSQMAYGLVGKWTSHLNLSEHGLESETIWKAGALVSGAPARFGLTAFAATLNEVTALEVGALPPTDSRRRPDQRAYEESCVDEAEKLKVKLEEGQRRRRGEMESRGELWLPRWFEKAGVEDEGDEVWRLKGPEGDSYWEVREAVVDLKRGQWDGVREVFEV